MTNGSRKYIEVVEWCGKLYDFINEHFFDGKLLKPVITVSPCGKNKAMGWFIRKGIWRESSEDKGLAEINISSNFLNCPAIDIAETMLHEMCHQFAHDNNIQDCSRSGNYHNKLFAKIAERHGLVVKKLPTVGYADTSLTEESKQLLMTFVGSIKLIYRVPEIKGARVQSTSTRKYVCPVCEISIRATRSVNLICADCSQPMLEENKS